MKAAVVGVVTSNMDPMTVQLLIVRRVMPKKPPSFSRKYPVTPLQESDEHHGLCPICGHWVDELDLHCQPRAKTTPLAVRH